MEVKPSQVKSWKCCCGLNFVVPRDVDLASLKCTKCGQSAVDWLPKNLAERSRSSMSLGLLGLCFSLLVAGLLISVEYFASPNVWGWSRLVHLFGAVVFLTSVFAISKFGNHREFATQFAGALARFAATITLLCLSMDFLDPEFSLEASRYMSESVLGFSSWIWGGFNAFLFSLLMTIAVLQGFAWELERPDLYELVKEIGRVLIAVTLFIPLVNLAVLLVQAVCLRQELSVPLSEFLGTFSVWITKVDLVCFLLFILWGISKLLKFRTELNSIAASAD